MDLLWEEDGIEEDPGLKFERFATAHPDILERLAAIDLEQDLPAGVEQRDYLLEALRSTIAKIKNGQVEGLLEWPTGAGKTAFALVLMQLLGVDNALWVGHSKESVKRPIQDIADLRLNISAELITGRRSLGERGNAKLRATTLQLLRRRGDEFTDEEAAKVQVVFIDEAHHAMSPEAQKYLSRFSNAIVINLSATPYLVGRELAAPHYHKLDAKRLQEDGYTVRCADSGAEKRQYFPPCLYRRIISRSSARKLDTYLDRFKIGGEQVEMPMNGNVITVPHFMARGAEVFMEHMLPNNEAGLFFLQSVADSKAFVEFMNAVYPESRGKIVHVDGQTQNREEIVRQLNCGEILAISGNEAIIESLNVKRLQHGVWMRVTGSKRIYKQAIGRLMRPSPSKGHFCWHEVTFQPEREYSGRASKPRRYQIVSAATVLGLDEFAADEGYMIASGEFAGQVVRYEGGPIDFANMIDLSEGVEYGVERVPLVEREMNLSWLDNPGVVKDLYKKFAQLFGVGLFNLVFSPDQYRGNKDPQYRLELLSDSERLGDLTFGDLYDATKGNGLFKEVLAMAVSGEDVDGVVRDVRRSWQVALVTSGDSEGGADLQPDPMSNPIPDLIEDRASLPARKEEFLLRESPLPLTGPFDPRRLEHLVLIHRFDAILFKAIFELAAGCSDYISQSLKDLSSRLSLSAVDYAVAMKRLASPEFKKLALVNGIELNVYEHNLEIDCGLLLGIWENWAKRLPRERAVLVYRYTKNEGDGADGSGTCRLDFCQQDYANTNYVSRAAVARSDLIRSDLALRLMKAMAAGRDLVIEADEIGGEFSEGELLNLLGGIVGQYREAMPAMYVPIKRTDAGGWSISTAHLRFVDEDGVAKDISGLSPNLKGVFNHELLQDRAMAIPIEGKLEQSLWRDLWRGEYGVGLLSGRQIWGYLASFYIKRPNYRGEWFANLQELEGTLANLISQLEANDVPGRLTLMEDGNMYLLELDVANLLGAPDYVAMPMALRTQDDRGMATYFARLPELQEPVLRVNAAGRDVLRLAFRYFADRLKYMRQTEWVSVATLQRLYAAEPGSKISFAQPKTRLTFSSPNLLQDSFAQQGLDVSCGIAIGVNDPTNTELHLDHDLINASAALAWRSLKINSAQIGYSKVRGSKSDGLNKLLPVVIDILHQVASGDKAALANLGSALLEKMTSVDVDEVMTELAASLKLLGVSINWTFDSGDGRRQPLLKIRDFDYYGVYGYTPVSEPDGAFLMLDAYGLGVKVVGVEPVLPVVKMPRSDFMLKLGSALAKGEVYCDFPIRSKGMDSLVHFTEQLELARIWLRAHGWQGDLLPPLAVKSANTIRLSLEGLVYKSSADLAALQEEKQEPSASAGNHEVVDANYDLESGPFALGNLSRMVPMQPQDRDIFMALCQQVREQGGDAGRVCAIDLRSLANQVNAPDYNVDQLLQRINDPNFVTLLQLNGIACSVSDGISLHIDLVKSHEAWRVRNEELPRQAVYLDVAHRGNMPLPLIEQTDFALKLGQRLRPGDDLVQVKTDDDPAVVLPNRLYLRIVRALESAAEDRIWVNRAEVGQISEERFLELLAAIMGKFGNEVPMINVGDVWTNQGGGFMIPIGHIKIDHSDSIERPGDQVLTRLMLDDLYALGKEMSLATGQLWRELVHDGKQIVVQGNTAKIAVALPEGPNPGPRFWSQVSELKEKLVQAGYPASLKLDPSKPNAVLLTFDLSKLLARSELMPVSSRNRLQGYEGMTSLVGRLPEELDSLNVDLFKSVIVSQIMSFVADYLRFGVRDNIRIPFNVVGKPMAGLMGYSSLMQITPPEGWVDDYVRVAVERFRHYGIFGDCEADGEDAAVLKFRDDVSLETVEMALALGALDQRSDVFYNELLGPLFAKLYTAVQAAISANSQLDLLKLSNEVNIAIVEFGLKEGVDVSNAWQSFATELMLWGIKMDFVVQGGAGSSTANCLITKLDLGLAFNSQKVSAPDGLKLKLGFHGDIVSTAEDKPVTSRPSQHFWDVFQSCWTAGDNYLKFELTADYDRAALARDLQLARSWLWTQGWRGGLLRVMSCWDEDRVVISLEGIDFIPNPEKPRSWFSSKVMD